MGALKDLFLTILLSSLLTGVAMVIGALLIFLLDTMDNDFATAKQIRLYIKCGMGVAAILIVALCLI